MNTYKITSLTNTFNKRDVNYNRTLVFDYIDNMVRNEIKLKSGESVYLRIQTLPLSVHRLRLKNLILVDDVNESEMKRLIKIDTKKPNTIKTNVKETNPIKVNVTIADDKKNVKEITTSEKSTNKKKRENIGDDEIDVKK